MKKLFVTPVLTLLLTLALSAWGQENAFMEMGAEVYQNECATCHGEQGQGGLGPAQAGNTSLQNVQHVLAQILYGEGEMPAFADELSDEQIAAVSTYIRNAWGNDFGAVEVAAVAQERQAGSETQEETQEAAQESAEATGNIEETGGAAEASEETEQTPEQMIATQGEGVALELVAEGLNSPVRLVSPPNDPRRFVVDRVGTIHIMDESGAMLPEPFLDLSDRIVELRAEFDERGLLGLAFHPNFADNGRFYVYYSAPLREEAPDDWNHTSHISEFKVNLPEDAAEGTELSSVNQADAGTERVLLQVDQPQFNHDAGDLAFGPDGLLFIALGDGGAADDVALGHPPMGHGQDITSMLGNILRIDVDRGWPGYAVPQDNPFVGRQGVDEAYAWGWRNPWRMSFDRSGNGDLLVATNGQNLWEAVYLVDEPGNYGWNILEGTHCFDPQNPNETAPLSACTNTGPQGEELKLPVIEYPHPANAEEGDIAGTSVIGGYMYRGEAVPALQGRYVFGDWSKSFTAPEGQVLVATPSFEGLWPLAQLAQLEHFILGFGEDSEGELYVLTTNSAGPTGETGKIYKLVAGQ